MKTNKRAPILLFAFAVMFAFVSVISAQPRKVGRYKEIAKTDVGAALAADFAVKERSKKTKMNFTLGEVVNAEDQELKGMNRNFRLCLKVNADGRKPSFVTAKVSVDQYTNFKLTSWVNSTCGTVPTDDYEQIEKTNAGAGLAADFAVHERSAKTKMKFTLDEIVKAESKGLFATTFRLCIKVTAGRKSSFVRAVVTMDQYSNFKLTSWANSTCGGN